MSLLECTSITKSFGGLLALDGVDLTVNAGEIVGLVGPNGSGKTTLLNMIGGSLPRTRGTVLFDGHDVSSASAHRRSRLGIARTFQVPRPLPSFDVLGNVMVPAMFGKDRSERDDARRTSMGILEQLGLAEHAHQPTTSLTLHERKFLEIARALALGPKLLLLDEVLGGLSPTEVEAGVDLIARLRDSGLSILYIEHNVKAVTRLADRLYVLDRGHNLASGIPSDVITDPRVVDAYLGGSHA